jgi:hypothetical protein
VRCSYIYFIKENPARVAAVAPEHAAYWRVLSCASTSEVRSPTGPAD